MEKLKKLYRNNTILFGTLILLIIFTLVNGLFVDKFLTAANIRNILKNAAGLIVLCTGFVIIINCGSIDLSVGTMVMVESVLIGYLVVLKEMNPVLVLFISLIVGIAMGLFNAVMIVLLNMPAFLATIGSSMLYTGIAYKINEWNGGSIYGMPGLIQWFGKAKLLGINVSVIIMVLVVVLGFIFLRYTRTGTYIYAIGGNRQVARLSGIPVGRVLFTAYVIAGVCAALCAWIEMGTVNASFVNIGNGYEFSCITAISVGGVAMGSGKGGSAFAALVGVLFINTFKNALNFWGAGQAWGLIVCGIIVVVAIGVDTAREAMSLKRKLSRQNEASAKEAGV